MEKFKIICTIGPSSNNPEILDKLKSREVDFFRINLSHTEEGDIEKRIKDLLGYGVPIILDTEGAQVRSGNTEKIDFEEGAFVKIYGKKVACDTSNLFLKPEGIIKNLEEGDLISIDFNSLLLRVIDTSKKEEGHILSKVLISGEIGGKKAVQIDSPTFYLPPFSKKDYFAVELAKKYGIKHFTLSFMESKQDVLNFKKNYPGATIYSKIESKKGLKNFYEIAEASDGVLIDRGDLSSQVPLEKIPFAQKIIIDKVRKMGKEAFVATNTLEQMAFCLKPSKAEVNDIINTILDGATGIALTKEMAVGKYPIETVNMLMNLIKQVEFLKKDKSLNLIESIEKTNYFFSGKNPDMLIEPHGGLLVNRYFPLLKNLATKTIEIDEETLMDVEQIAIGAFSPLEGFIGNLDFKSVINNMRLSNGIVWPLPLVLAVDDKIRSGISEGEDIALAYKGKQYAILHLDEIYKVDKKEAVKKIYGTDSVEHPGVKKFLSLGDNFLGGKISLLKRRKSDNKMYEFTPEQTRKIFSERGWSKVLGFHTRNVIHRSHEFIQLGGMKKGLCDGLFVHPVIGKKKSGDFEANVIIKAYEQMMDSFYPKSKVVFGTFATYSRYAGPREAIFTALTRKNFGCSHFIVGRDHTGVGNFYGPNDSHEIFKRFTKEELGIEPIIFDKVFYSDLENKHIHEPEYMGHPEEYKLHISGTQARAMLLKGLQPPEWFMRPEISQMIIDKIKNGERVFVE